jgi:murein DD-endopeptidase MepM/ murein hydrolase activator NlpD
VSTKRALLALSAVLTLLLAGGAVAISADRPAGASSRAFAIQIVASSGGGGTKTITAPEDAVQFGGPNGFPADGSIARWSSSTASVSAHNDRIATAQASGEVTSLTLFNGEITATDVAAKASSTASASNAAGNADGSAVSGLVVLGQAVAATLGQSLPLADWGTITLLGETGAASTTGLPGYHGVVTALDVHLTADHGGLAAGSDIQVGFAEVTTQASAAPPPPTAPSTPTITTIGPGARGKPKAPEPNPSGIPGPTRRPPTVTPKLTAGGYVFPVYGPVAFTDTFGAFRGDVPGNWHHGDDVFAPLGAPVLAVASGTVFSVGWQPIGGNRLWLRDGQGNEFYYAHLSAYTPFAKNGAVVQAGDVLGFVGNTGDAEGTPYHLHFEIHPVGMLGYGYDGAVDPTSYLMAWEHLRDLPIEATAGFAVPPITSAQAPKPGAILLQASDISSASGLDPASLQRAMNAPVREGDNGVLLPPAPAG